MIAFGSLEPSGAFEARVRAHGEPDSVVYVSDAPDVIAGYAEIASAARGAAGIEGLVLARPGAAFGSPGLCARIRSALLAGVGLVAAAGARDVQDLRWWTAERVVSGEAHCPAPGVIVLAPAALDLVCADRAGPDAAFEAEIAFQARARGLSVVVTDLGCVPEPSVVDQAFLDADAWWRARWSGVGA